MTSPTDGARSASTTTSASHDRNGNVTTSMMTIPAKATTSVAMAANTQRYSNIAAGLTGVTASASRTPESFSSTIKKPMTMPKDKARRVSKAIKAMGRNGAAPSSAW